MIDICVIYTAKMFFGLVGLSFGNVWQEGQYPEHGKAWNAAVKASLQDSSVWKALRLLLDKGAQHS